MPSLALVGGTAAQRRKLRKPVHNFNLVTRPWQIQPFLLAPVLPGETMENAFWQARVVTDPLVNPLIGWWKEYYLFYVKLRDLDARADFTEMMLDFDKDMSALNEAASLPYYHHGGAINYAKLCLKRVVEEFFRNEGEAWDDYLVNGMPAASVSQSNWMNSMLSGDDYVVDDVTLDTTDNAVTASEIDAALRTWNHQRIHGLTEMSYEDFLRTYGVSVQQSEELHVPELLRYVRDWTYPTNTVDPATGSPSSACSWSISERADKSRFFKEHGFVFGVTVTRPKVYFTNLEGSLADNFNNALSWLPAVMNDDPYTSLRQFAETEGPLAATFTDAQGYWVDLKDLLLYGDQFVNYDLASGSNNAVALPKATLQRFYADTADAASLFVDTDPGTAVTVREDGVIALSIKSIYRDTTPGVPINSAV